MFGMTSSSGAGYTVRAMVRLYDVGDNRLCGTLSDRQFDALVEALEEEELEDGDCAIDQDTIESLEEQGLDADVLEVLRLALGDRREALIRCERG
jgi:hypothetical protein